MNRSLGHRLGRRPTPGLALAEFHARDAQDSPYRSAYAIRQQSVAARICVEQVGETFRRNRFPEIEYFNAFHGEPSNSLRSALIGLTQETRVANRQRFRGVWSLARRRGELGNKMPSVLDLCGFRSRPAQSDGASICDCISTCSSTLGGRRFPQWERNLQNVHSRPPPPPTPVPSTRHAARSRCSSK